MTTKLNKPVRKKSNINLKTLGRISLFFIVFSGAFSIYSFMSNMPFWGYLNAAIAFAHVANAINNFTEANKWDKIERELDRQFAQLEAEVNKILEERNSDGNVR